MSSERSRQWLDRAVEDLAVAQLVFREDYFSHACFLAQQSIEKTLKGYLLWVSNTYPRVHNLVDLLALREKYDLAFEGFRQDRIIMDQYYIPTRYPNGIPGSLLDGLPGPDEASEAINIAGRIQHWVLSKLPPATSES
jgi:HEPN domain-containing protein